MADVDVIDANGSCARFAGSGLDHLILFGERRLLHVLKEFVVHYHEERNHQGPRQRLDCASSQRDRQRPSSLPRTLGRPVALLLPGTVSVGRVFGQYGHASIGQTADTYGHVQPERHEAAAAGFDCYLV
jgi:hypothetical protein